MCPAMSSVVLKMQRPVMSLKQFMLRSEILNLYRGYLRLGRMLNEPTKSDTSHLNNSTSNPNTLKSPSDKPKSVTPMRDEWNGWVRSEFRLRQNSATDDEITKALLAQGKRQLQELERTITLATNRNAQIRDSADKSKSNLKDLQTETKTKGEQSKT